MAYPTLTTLLLLLLATATAAFIPHADLSGTKRLDHKTCPLSPFLPHPPTHPLLPGAARSGRLSVRKASPSMSSTDISHLKKYCESVYQTNRRPTRTVWAGKVREPSSSTHPTHPPTHPPIYIHHSRAHPPTHLLFLLQVPIGSEHPIACQTMGTPPTPATSHPPTHPPTLFSRFPSAPNTRLPAKPWAPQTLVTSRPRSSRLCEWRTSGTYSSTHPPTHTHTPMSQFISVIRRSPTHLPTHLPTYTKKTGVISSGLLYKGRRKPRLATPSAR